MIKKIKNKKNNFKIIYLKGKKIYAYLKKPFRFSTGGKTFLCKAE